MSLVIKDRSRKRKIYFTIAFIVLFFALSGTAAWAFMQALQSAGETDATYNRLPVKSTTPVQIIIPGESKSPSPTPSKSPTPTPSPTPKPVKSKTPSPSPTASTSPSPTPTPTQSVIPSPTPTTSPTTSPEPTDEP